MNALSNSFVSCIEQAVLQATRGRVGKLDIAHRGHEIVLKGRCPTFTCKKLAQEAVLPLIGEAKLVNAIEVG